MKNLLYVLLFPFLLVSCFEKKETVSPKMAATTTQPAPATLLGTYTGTYTQKNPNGSIQAIPGTYNQTFFTDNLGNLCLYHPTTGNVNDSLIVTLNGTNFTVQCRPLPDTPAGTQPSTAYYLTASGTVSADGNTINFQWVVQYTDPTNRNQTTSWGTFTRQ